MLHFNFFRNVLIISTSLILLSCSGSQQVVSTKTSNIQIDGKYSEWEKMINIKGENISFGFSNDDNNLYLCIITNDRSKVTNILRGGLEIWIESNNENSKIGILYPEKPEKTQMIEPRKNRKVFDNEESGERKREEDMEANMNKMINDFLERQNELLVLDDNEKVIQSFSPIGNSYRAKINFDQSVFCYELKIPFGKKPFLDINLAESKENKVTISFESGKIESQLEPMRSPQGMVDDGNQQGMNNNGYGRMNRSENISDGKIDYKFEVKLKK